MGICASDNKETERSQSSAIELAFGDNLRDWYRIALPIDGGETSLSVELFGGNHSMWVCDCFQSDIFHWGNKNDKKYRSGDDFFVQ